MTNIDKDPLDLFEDDGDGVNEMGLLFDEKEENKQDGHKPSGSSGCCVVFLTVSASLLMAGWGIIEVVI